MPNHPINKDTQLCISLAGRPGNFGTRFHNALFAELDLNYLYKAMTTQDLPGAVRGIRALGIRGCAVSMPFKEDVIPLLDALDPSASVIASVNTIVNSGEALRGYNTDFLAVYQLLEGLHPQTRFVLRGSGGMAKAVAAALKQRGLSGTIAARNAAKGQALAAQYGFEWQPEVTDSAELLINATPLGMSGPEADTLAFSQAQVAASQVVFDVVALPSQTPLLREAQKQDKRVISGAQVAVLQAVEQFTLYTGVRPSPEQIVRAAEYAQSSTLPT